MVLKLDELKGRIRLILVKPFKIYISFDFQADYFH